MSLAETVWLPVQHKLDPLQEEVAFELRRQLTQGGRGLEPCSWGRWLQKQGDWGAGRTERASECDLTLSLPSPSSLSLVKEAQRQQGHLECSIRACIKIISKCDPLLLVTDNLCIPHTAWTRSLRTGARFYLLIVLSLLISGTLVHCKLSGNV